MNHHKSRPTLSLLKRWGLAIGFLILLSLFFSPCGFAQPTTVSPYKVHDFGAQGDGTTLDTAALQKAIDACASAGGGTVYFTPGTYLTRIFHS